jgi:hypothetical protein
MPPNPFESAGGVHLPRKSAPVRPAEPAALPRRVHTSRLTHPCRAVVVGAGFAAAVASMLLRRAGARCLAIDPARTEHNDPDRSSQPPRPDAGTGQRSRHDHGPSAGVPPSAGSSPRVVLLAPHELARLEEECAGFRRHLEASRRCVEIRDVSLEAGAHSAPGPGPEWLAGLWRNAGPLWLSRANLSRGGGTTPHRWATTPVDTHQGPLRYLIAEESAAIAALETAWQEAADPGDDVSPLITGGFVLDGFEDREHEGIVVVSLRPLRKAGKGHNDRSTPASSQPEAAGTAEAAGQDEAAGAADQPDTVDHDRVDTHTNALGGSSGSGGGGSGGSVCVEPLMCFFFFFFFFFFFLFFF